jgi:uncharacterized damage-inducible protein DinB
MIEQIKWFDRAFTFDQPLGVLPCILERLRGASVRALEISTSYPTDLLRHRSSGHWSMQEHLGHLFVLDELHNSRIDDYIGGASMLRPADLKNRKTTEANFNAQDIASIVSDFREARERFVTRLESVDESVLSRSAIHPRIKIPMRLLDMAIFVAEHDDHHFAMMRGLARTAVRAVQVR